MKTKIEVTKNPKANSVFVHIPTPASKFKVKEEPEKKETELAYTDNTKRALRACFAILSRISLKPYSEDDFWTYIKGIYGIESRTMLGEREMVRLEARLRAAQTNRILRQALINKMNNYFKKKQNDR